MMFNSANNERFREQTKAFEASAPGCTNIVKRCVCCGKHKKLDGGKVKRGTSRHNPEQFTCGDCVNGNLIRKS